MDANAMSRRRVGSASGVVGVVGVALVVFALVILRQPHRLLRPQFVWEETAAFWAASFTLDPIHYVLEPWAGYFHILPRTAFLVARLPPPEIAPAVTLTLHAAVIALVASLMASTRMTPVFRDRRVQVTGAIGLALLPWAEPYVSVLSMQWFLALYLACLSRVPARNIDYPLVAIAALSGIGAAIAAPLYFLDWRPGRRFDRRGLILVAVLAVQVLSVMASGREPRSLDLLPILLGALGIGGLVLWPSMVPATTRVSFGVLAIVTLSLGIVAMGVSGRYLVAASALAVFVAAALIAHRRFSGLAIGAVTATLMLGAFAIPPESDSDWPAQARCIGGPRRCHVAVTPPEWSVEWSSDWVPPAGMDPYGMPIQ